MPDAIVFPQDIGTGDTAEGETDWSSAGHFAGLAYSPNAADYVAAGLSFTPDFGVPEVAISDGLAFITVDTGVAVQDYTEEDDDVYGATWSQPVVFVVAVEGDTVALDPDTQNEVWLSIDLDNPNAAAYTLTEPADPAILVGTVDTDADEHEETNREPDAEFGHLEATKSMRLPSTFSDE